MNEYRIVYHEQAEIDRQEAAERIRSYYRRRGDIRKGNEWAKRFRNELVKNEGLLKENPFRHPHPPMYPFDQVDTTMRYFSVTWNTVFYDVVGDEVVVLAILSNRTDFNLHFKVL